MKYEPIQVVLYVIGIATLVIGFSWGFTMPTDSTIFCVPIMIAGMLAILFGVDAKYYQRLNSLGETISS